MSVCCPSCGRQYDPALFAFGRTIHCACGQRVAAAPRGIDPADGERRFMVDAMLGRLARWLRLLGFDTAYETDIADGELVRRALAEQRIILTRDRALPVEWRVSAIHLVAAERPIEQLREVAAAFDLADCIRLFTRCSRCNTPLDEAGRDEASTRVPPRVLDRVEHFLHCPLCDRFYWSGSHTQRMRRMIDRALGIAEDR